MHCFAFTTVNMMKLQNGSKKPAEMIGCGTSILILESSRPSIFTWNNSIHIKILGDKFLCRLRWYISFLSQKFQLTYDSISCDKHFFENIFSNAIILSRLITQLLLMCISKLSLSNQNDRIQYFKYSVCDEKVFVLVRDRISW